MNLTIEYLKVISSARPYLWVGILVVVFSAGAGLGNPLWTSLLIGVGLCCSASAGFIFNDICDRTLDARKSEPRLSTASPRVLNACMMMAALLTVGAFFVAWALSGIGGLALAAVAAISLLYSVGISSMLGLGNILSAALVCSTLTVPIAAAVDRGVVIECFFLVMAVVGFAVAMVREVVMDVRDMEADRLGGRKSFPIVYGRAKALVGAGAVLMASGVALGVLGIVRYAPGLTDAPALLRSILGLLISLATGFAILRWGSACLGKPGDGELERVLRISLMALVLASFQLALR